MSSIVSLQRISLKIFICALRSLQDTISSTPGSSMIVLISGSLAILSDVRSVFSVMTSKVSHTVSTTKSILKRSINYKKKKYLNRKTCSLSDIVKFRFLVIISLVLMYHEMLLQNLRISKMESSYIRYAMGGICFWQGEAMEIKICMISSHDDLSRQQTFMQSHYAGSTVRIFIVPVM